MGKIIKENGELYYVIKQGNETKKIKISLPKEEYDFSEMKTKVLDTDSENLTKEERDINELFEDVLNYMMIEKINKVVIPDKYGEKDFQISLDLVSKNKQL